MSSPITQTARFPCVHCGRILAAPASVWGTQQACPHCQRVVNVPGSDATAALVPPVQQAAEARQASIQPGETDELWAPGELAPAEQQAYVPVHCRVCDTRMYSTVAQVGSDVTCPDCGAKTKVKMVATKLGSVPPISVPGEGYELSEPPTEMTMELVGYGQPLKTMLGVLEDKQAALPETRPDYATKRKRNRAPKYWMLQGVFLYAFTPRVFAIVAMVVALTPIAGYLLVAIAYLSNTVVAPFAVFAVVMEVALVGWTLSYLATMLLAVAEVSSDGVDSIAGEFDLMFADRVLRLLFLVAGWVYALAPGAIVNLVAGAPAEWQIVAGTPLNYPTLISLFMLLPVTQLSVLEASSLVVPVSYEILRGLWRNRWAGAAFYAVAALIFLAAAVSMGLLLPIVLKYLDPISFVALSLAITYCLVTYYRLLGRFAWYCAENTPPLESKRTSDSYEPLYP